jgi:hypothetical protein
MLDNFKKLTANQFEASLCALNSCIDKCPESGWNAPVANLLFCQVAFHTLFFTDYYLGLDPDSLKQQEFHREKPVFFRDYEELEWRKQQLLYERDAIKNYLEHCRKKAIEVLAKETEESLNACCGFPPREFSRAEMHLYNIRHIQHHAAQLSLRLRIDADLDIPWFSSSWSAESGNNQ